MSILTALVNFKLSLLEALVGTQSFRPGIESAKPQKPGWGNWGQHHRPHTNRYPGYNHSQPAKSVCYKSHPHYVAEHQLPSRPVFSLFSLNR